MSTMKSRMVRVVLVALGLTMAGTLWAQQSRNQQVSERISSVDNVCMAGEECAAAGTATMAQAGTDFSVDGTYEQYCAMCHNTGMAGAPELGADDFWSERLDEVGFETIVTNAIDGVNAMPPRGMCNDCSDTEIGELVEYLLGDAM